MMKNSFLKNTLAMAAAFLLLAGTRAVKADATPNASGSVIGAAGRGLSGFVVQVRFDYNFVNNPNTQFTPWFDAQSSGTFGGNGFWGYTGSPIVGSIARMGVTARLRETG